MYQPRFLSFTSIAAVAVGIWAAVTQVDPQLPEHHSPTLSGNVVLDSDINLNLGTISPGNSPGKISITGDFELGNDATYECELQDLSGPGFGHDYIDVMGNLLVGGTLDIVLDGYTPMDSHCFNIIEFDGSISGTFSSIQGMPIGWNIDYGVLTPNTVTIYGPSCQQTVGIQDSQFSIENLSFYPNPANSFITFNQTVENVSVYHSGGQLVLTQNRPSSVVDISSLFEGFYILSINNGKAHRELVVTSK